MGLNVRRTSERRAKARELTRQVHYYQREKYVHTERFADG